MYDTNKAFFLFFGIFILELYSEQYTLKTDVVWPFANEHLLDFFFVIWALFLIPFFLFVSLFEWYLFKFCIMDDGKNTNIDDSSVTMPLSLDAHTRGKCKLVKCSRHFNQNGLISMGDRIYANNTTTDQCNYSKCLTAKIWNETYTTHNKHI